MVGEWQKDNEKQEKKEYRVKRCIDMMGRKYVKPPLGLVPAKTFYALRLQDINQAIKRYVEFGKDIPYMWIMEKENLEEYLN